MTTKNKIPLEIERKFILKKLPLFDKKVELIDIVQFYVGENKQKVRYRRSLKPGGIKLSYFTPSGQEVKYTTDAKGEKYHQTIKRAISKGVWEENEKSIQAKQFVVDLSAHIKRKVLFKVRYVYKYKGLKFEVDVYRKLTLVTLEVELDDIKQKIEFPDCIKREILMEVTGRKEFSNYNLAEEHRGKINGSIFADSF
jgi:CYTH domain-containing protein